MNNAAGKRRKNGKKGMDEPKRRANHPEGDENLPDGASGGFGSGQHGVVLWGLASTGEASLERIVQRCVKRGRTQGSG
jgi:hypothetical protein